MIRAECPKCGHTVPYTPNNCEWARSHRMCEECAFDTIPGFNRVFPLGIENAEKYSRLEWENSWLIGAYRFDWLRWKWVKKNV